MSLTDSTRRCSDPDEAAPIVFEADIKDASLASVRNDLLALGRKFRTMGQAAAADAVSRALAFVRRSASLPVGLREARDIADILHEGDRSDEHTSEIQSLIRISHASSYLTTK